MYAGLAVAAFEAALAAVALPTVVGPYLFACAAATVVVAIVLPRVAGRPPDDEDDGGGGGPGGPPEPPDEPPPWWPEFEAAFRAYERDRSRPPVH